MRAPRPSLNGLYEFGTGTALVRTERLLWIDPGKFVAILIEVRSPQAWEHSVPYKTFYDDVSNGTARLIEELPEFRYLMQPDSAFSAAQIRERDDRCAAMEIFLKKPPEERFDPRERAKAFAEISSRPPHFREEDIEKLSDPKLIQILIPHLDLYRLKSGLIRNPLHINKGTLYKIYRRLLQSGGVQRVNGLLSLRHRAGWHTENRLAHEPTKKLGRGWIGDSEGERRAGRIVTPDIEPVLVNIGIMFHETRVGERKLNWPDAVRMGQQAFFSNGWKEDGDILVPDMPDGSLLFTEWQIRRAYYKHRNANQIIPAREGERAFNLKLRPTTDDRRAIASRPLQLIQSDCWDVPIYLVHPVTRRVIGRPLLVAMRDTMSGLGAGLALTWNHEGWRANLLCLENLVADKVEYCKSVGETILPEWWPCQGYIGENLLSDNGAWITKMAAHVRRGLGLFEIWNTGTARGDMKPVIETLWDDLYERVIKTLPGALPAHALSADTDPTAKRAWERASLDIHQLEQVIVRYFLHLNRFRFFKDYPLTDAMKAANVRPIPLELWNWGMDEYGLPNPMTMDTVWINCLEPVEFTVTRDGLKLQEKLLFTCDTAEREGWYIRAKGEHTWTIKGLIDTRRLDRAFRVLDQKLLRPGDRELEDCRRIKARRERTDLQLKEFEIEQHRQKAERNRYNREMPANDAYLDGHTNHIVEEAKAMTAEALDGAKQTNEDLRGRRQEAKEEENGNLPGERAVDVSVKIPPKSDFSPLQDQDESELDLYRN